MVRNPWLMFIALVLLFPLTADAASPQTPTNQPDQATVEGLAGLRRSEGWRVQVVGAAAAVNAFASAPATVTTPEILWQIRYVKARHCDFTDAAAEGAVRLGPDTDTPALDANGGERLLGYGDGTQFQIVRPTSSVTAVTDLPRLWLFSPTATLDVCVTVYW